MSTYVNILLQDFQVSGVFFPCSCNMIKKNLPHKNCFILLRKFS